MRTLTFNCYREILGTWAGMFLIKAYYAEDTRFNADIRVYHSFIHRYIKHPNQSRVVNIRENYVTNRPPD